MPKKPKRQNRMQQRPMFVLWLVIFWAVVWLAIYSLQLFDRTGAVFMALNFETIVAMVTVLTFLLSGYGAMAVSWLKIRYMQKGKQ